MKPEFSHVRNILINTISLLCKNSLSYQQGLRIHGLLGITLDEEVFLVEISEHFVQKDPESCAVITATGVKLKQDCDRVAEDGSENLSMPKQKNKRSDVSSRLPNGSVEEISESVVKNSTPGSQIVVATPFDPYVDVISIKEESMEVDALQKFLLENSNVSQPAVTIADQHLPEQGINYSSTMSFTEATTVLKAEEDVVEILADDPNEVDWNADSYANSFVGHSWLQTPQNHPPAGTTSLTKVAEKKSRIQRHGLTGDVRSPTAPDSVHMQRWYTWSTSRRPAASAHKQFKCDIEDCTRSYYAKKNLLRHQTTVHGRVPVYRRTSHRSHFY